MPSRVRPHVSISPALPEALASWGILLPDGIRPDRLLAPSGENRLGLPRSVYPFRVTLGWHSTPCPSYVSGETHVLAYAVAEWGHVPFGPAYVCFTKLQPLWQVLTHDAYVPSSNILSIVTCLRRRHLRLVAYPLLTRALRRALATRKT